MSHVHAITHPGFIFAQKQAQRRVHELDLMLRRLELPADQRAMAERERDALSEWLRFVGARP